VKRAQVKGQLSCKWLLVPMQPTPNGRLHIGHGGGPYLRADAIARALRRAGCDAAILTGTDAYENWVLTECVQSGREPADVCAEYHAGIGADLALLNVDLDLWIDPLAPAHERSYIALHEQLLARLEVAGAARLEQERIPVGQSSGRPLVGPWIAGRCPACGQPCGGNTCTHCGGHFQPDQVIEPRSRLSDEPISWVEQVSWFIAAADPAATLAALQATGVSDELLAPVKRYLSLRNGRVRLSHPGTWGVASELAPAGSVLSNTYYGYSLYCGQLYADSHALASGNAFAGDSGVTVVGLFGTDNSIAGMVTPQVIAEHTSYKPFDFTVVNHMMYLDDRKCSTSKRHGIWIAELLGNTSVTADELRYYLTRISLDRAIGNVTVAAMVDEINRLRKWRRERLAPALSIRQARPSPRLLVALNESLERQEHHLIPPGVDLAEAAREAEEWMFGGAGDDYWWLIGVALLTVPIMPRLAAQIWTSLGLRGQPARALLKDVDAVLAIRPSGIEVDLGPDELLSSGQVEPHVRLGA
jgi:methionyl-tRNA synthetase